MCNQKVIWIKNNYEELDNYFLDNKISKIFCVCGKSFKKLSISKYFSELSIKYGIDITYFNDFCSNPLYSSVCEAVEMYNRDSYDIIVAVGGGSAIDVAKCVKLFSNMDAHYSFLEQQAIPNGSKLLAIPTTAGSGSEATKYAVVYLHGEKQSISDESVIPETVVFIPDLLLQLPLLHKQAPMLDAMCHAIESFWSIHSNDESKGYSTEAIKIILQYKDLYLENDETGIEKMQQAAYLSGKAINITQTTAAHAMSYKLTSLYGIPHGFAVAICLSKLWAYMLDHTKECIDIRGEQYLLKVFAKLGEVWGCNNEFEARDKFENLVDGMCIPKLEVQPSDYEILKNSVNLVRLKNNPIKLEQDDMDFLYHEIFKESETVEQG